MAKHEGLDLPSRPTLVAVKFNDTGKVRLVGLTDNYQFVAPDGYHVVRVADDKGPWEVEKDVDAAS